MDSAESMLPLADLRIVSVEQFGAGPWGTVQLADLGADVIKVEDPTVGGDVGRYVPPFQEQQSSLFFETFNRSKRSIALDLRNPAARCVLEDLVRNSDAVFSNLRGDRAASLRIRYADLAHINARVVCVSLSGFGNTGPRVAEGAYDVTIQALAGWMSLTGGPDEPPTKSGFSLVDFSGGYVAALSLLAAVWEARRDGAGKDVDVSLFESALALQTYMATWAASRAWSANRIADSAHQSIVPFQLFPAADGWLMVACAKESLWRKLCDAIERTELTSDPRFSDMAARSGNRVELVTLLKDVFRKRSVSDWIDLLSSFDIPCAPVNSLEEALADEQSLARGSLVDYDHPVLGRVTTVKSALGSTMTRPPNRAPFLGESTVEVLTNVCGYDSLRIDELARQGAFGEGQAPSGMHAR